MLTFQDYRNALFTNIRKPKMKVEVLHNEDESIMQEIIGDIEDSGGSLVVNNQNGLRRSTDFTLLNLSGNYIPSPDSLIWLRRKIKVYLGLEINNEDLFFPQGIFVVENPSASSIFGKSTLSVKAQDKFSLLDGSIGGSLDSLYTIPVGSNIYSVIKSILIEVGDKKPPILHTKFINEVTPYTIEKEINSSYGDIINEFAEMLSANVFYNVDGQLVFEPDTDDKIKGSEWDFSIDEFNYLGATQEFKFNEIYNSVKVIGDNINGEIYDYETKNENLLSFTSIPNVGFKRTKVITDNNIYSTDLARQRSEYELKRVMALQSAISITSVPMYHLDVDNVISLTDSKLKLNKERFLIQGFTIPFKNGSTMSIDAVKSVELLL